MLLIHSIVFCFCYKRLLIREYSLVKLHTLLIYILWQIIHVQGHLLFCKHSTWIVNISLRGAMQNILYLSSLSMVIVNHCYRYLLKHTSLSFRYNFDPFYNFKKGMKMEYPEKSQIQPELNRFIVFQSNILSTYSSFSQLTQSCQCSQ